MSNEHSTTMYATSDIVKQINRPRPVNYMDKAVPLMVGNHRPGVLGTDSQICDGIVSRCIGSNQVQELVESSTLVTIGRYMNLLRLRRDTDDHMFDIPVAVGKNGSRPSSRWRTLGYIQE